MATYIGKHYKLRAGSPMPTKTPGHFVFHTFKAATNDSIIETCTATIPRSDEFVGQGKTDGYQSASFARLPISANGKELFRGKTTKKDLYDEENAWGFN